MTHTKHKVGEILRNQDYRLRSSSYRTPLQAVIAGRVPFSLPGLCTTDAYLIARGPRAVTAWGVSLEKTIEQLITTEVFPGILLSRTFKFLSSTNDASQNPSS